MDYVKRMMAEMFDNKFHKKYVGGAGEVKEPKEMINPLPSKRGVTYERVLAEYRKYVNDPLAELPEVVAKAFLLTSQRTENDRKT